MTINREPILKDICQHCGTYNADGQNCSACGAPLYATNAEQQLFGQPVQVAPEMIGQRAAVGLVVEPVVDQNDPKTAVGSAGVKIEKQMTWGCINMV